MMNYNLYKPNLLALREADAASRDGPPREKTDILNGL
jgi:hypothetical protein